MNILDTCKTLKAYILELIADKQDKLVSGQNIKTVNGTSLVGEGDVTIGAGGAVINDDSTTLTSTWSSSKLSGLLNAKSSIGHTHSASEVLLPDGVSVFSALQNVQWITGRVTSVSSSSTHSQYPSAKCVYDALTGKANSSHTHSYSGITVDNITNLSEFLTNKEHVCMLSSGASTINIETLLTDSKDSLCVKALLSGNAIDGKTLSTALTSSTGKTIVFAGTDGTVVGKYFNVLTIYNITSSAVLVKYEFGIDAD